MKSLLIALLFFTGAASASGRLSVTGNSYNGHDSIHPVIGMSVDEVIPFFKLLAINGWAGYGQRPIEDGDKSWIAGKLGLEARFRHVDIGVGYFANNGGLFDAVDGGERGGFAKLSLKLW